MTRLGIKTGALAALMCIVGMVSGYIGALIIAGYVLLFESDRMLRSTVTRALIVMCLVSLGGAAVNLIPSAISWISEFLGIFGGSLYIGFLSTICSWIKSTLNIGEIIILGLMAFKAMKNEEFTLGFIDKIMTKVESDNINAD